MEDSNTASIGGSEAQAASYLIIIRPIYNALVNYTGWYVAWPLLSIESSSVSSAEFLGSISARAHRHV